MANRPSSELPKLPTGIDGYAGIHWYTLLQIVLTAGIFAVTLTPGAPVFPVIIVLLVPIRLKIMNRWWRKETLKCTFPSLFRTMVFFLTCEQMLIRGLVEKASYMTMMRQERLSIERSRKTKRPAQRFWSSLNGSEAYARGFYNNLSPLFMYIYSPI
jgi:hypothetical protein